MANQTSPKGPCVPIPVELIAKGRPTAVSLYGSVAAYGGIACDGCSKPIAALGIASGVCLKVARRELQWLAQNGWISEVHHCGQAIIRRNEG
jgi:hypothetical protein